MSTFTLPDTSPEVPVHLTQDLRRDQLLQFPAFKNWISTLQHSLSLQSDKNHTFNSAPYKLRSIDIHSVDFFGGGRLGFVKLKAEVSNDLGENLPGSVFLRGGSVGMMVRVSSICVSWELESNAEDADDRLRPNSLSSSPTTHQKIPRSRNRSSLQFSPVFLLGVFL